MGPEPAPAPVSIDRPLRAWPTAALAAVYWIVQVVFAQLDMPMFSRFMSNAMSALGFLIVFLVLWLSNGTVRGRSRVLVLGTFVGGLVAGMALAHRSFDPVSFMLTSVPIVLTAWALGILLVRQRPSRQAAAALALGIPVSFLYFDVIRWDGLDGRLKATHSFRWADTPEDAFLATRGAAGAGVSTKKAWTLKPGDWPEFRGAARDGVVHGVRIETNWKDVPPQLVWKQRVGPGWSSVIVVDGFLVTQEQRGEAEAVVCYEAETGKEVWVHEDRSRFSEGIAGAGPRATPTFHDGRIYSLGGGGLVTCVEAPTGKLVWLRDLAKESSAKAPQWGYSASPLVVDGKVIVFAGGPSARGITALDTATGAPVWAKLVGKESYCSAQLLSVHGKPLLLMQDNKAMAGLSVADGAVLWERPAASEANIPMLQSSPFEEGKVLVASGPGLALLEIREDGGKWSVAELWSTPKFRPSFSNFVHHDGHVYGVDEGVLACVDAKTGERRWRKGRYGSGQLILLADQGLLVLVSEQGELALLDAKPQEPEEVFRLKALDGKTWNHPAIAEDRLIVRNGTEMACYRLRILKSP
ncbi:MAG TPA: PQQ-binding-like beta-propeller repeat protein [Planctomycetota bacterium]|nr:PQQ-binding-like beta-propeller repeat protein [Planctomycetota bacterium]